MHSTKSSALLLHFCFRHPTPVYFRGLAKYTLTWTILPGVFPSERQDLKEVPNTVTHVLSSLFPVSSYTPTQWTRIWNITLFFIEYLHHPLRKHMFNLRWDGLFLSEAEIEIWIHWIKQSTGFILWLLTCRVGETLSIPMRISFLLKRSTACWTGITSLIVYLQESYTSLFSLHVLLKPHL